VTDAAKKSAPLQNAQSAMNIWTGMADSAPIFAQNAVIMSRKLGLTRNFIEVKQVDGNKCLPLGGEGVAARLPQTP